ncbi:acetyltransferase [Synergistaceae bacterium OttesenSCG-928-D05]|nr:acetyltransferase [Synergistaceae bacterium OttesenSCG-928-D05]
MEKDSIYLIGAGNHAKVVMTMLEVCGFACKGIYDDNESMWGKEIWNVPVLGPTTDLPDKEGIMAVIGIGSNQTRKEISERFENVVWPVLIHPTSVVHSSTRIGGGTVILPGCIIQADAKIGHHTIINTGAVVDHDCIIGNYCHLAPRCCVADGVAVDDGAFIGMGSVVIPYTHIASNVVLGPGSTAVKNLDSEGVYFGTPAHRVPKFLIPDAD